MSRPSISVMKCGSDFKRASHLLQSYSVPQYWMSFCIVPSCTPCVSPSGEDDQIRREAASDTNSRSGHRVAAMRRRSSAISSGGKLTVKGRIELSPAAARNVPGKHAEAPAAAVAARSSRRVGDNDIADMISSCSFRSDSNGLVIGCQRGQIYYTMVSPIPLYRWSGETLVAHQEKPTPSTMEAFTDLPQACVAKGWQWRPISAASWTCHRGRRCGPLPDGHIDFVIRRWSDAGGGADNAVLRCNNTARTMLWRRVSFVSRSVQSSAPGRRDDNNPVRTPRGRAILGRRHAGGPATP